MAIIGKESHATITNNVTDAGKSGICPSVTNQSPLCHIIWRLKSTFPSGYLPEMTFHVAYLRLSTYEIVMQTWLIGVLNSPCVSFLIVRHVGHKLKRSKKLFWNFVRVGAWIQLASYTLSPRIVSKTFTLWCLVEISPPYKVKMPVTGSRFHEARNASIGFTC